jgi:hypothetical protein
MLSDEDKARIKAEEEYRAQVRAELGRPKRPAPSTPDPNNPLNKVLVKVEPPGWVIAAIVLTIIVTAGIVINAFRANPGVARQTTPEPKVTEGMAYEACKSMVTDRLKAPGSARFQGIFEANLVNHGDRISWDGWVDSQNGFGALLRTRFNCYVTIDDEKVHLTIY